MNWIVKQASFLSEEEKTALGISGIPNAWPIETYPYTSGDVPNGFSVMSDVDLLLLKDNNQAAYDAWLASKTPPAPEASPLLVHINATDKESDDKPYFREAITHASWFFSPHAIDFYTAKVGSLYNRDHSGNGIDAGTDAGDAWLVFYDASGVEIVKGNEESNEDYQTRLTATCIKTIMFWEKKTSFDINSAHLYVRSAPLERAYLWVIAAPDVPVEYGGNKPFMGRGMNLQMMAPGHPHYFDGRTVSTINYDTTYHSGKLATVVKHSVGEQIGIQIIFGVYDA
jgi:hypothetical protein